MVFGDIIYDHESRNLWLEVKNLGIVDSGVAKIWIARAVNSDGNEGSKISLPILIETLTHGIMAKSHSTIKIGIVTLVDIFFPRLTVSGSNSNGQDSSLNFTLGGFEWAGNANRIYISVSISHASRHKTSWYELQSLASAPPHIVATFVRKPLTEKQIMRQRVEKGLLPAKQSPEPTKYEN